MRQKRTALVQGEKKNRLSHAQSSEREERVQKLTVEVVGSVVLRLLRSLLGVHVCSSDTVGLLMNERCLACCSAAVDAEGIIQSGVGRESRAL